MYVKLLQVREATNEKVKSPRCIAEIMKEEAKANRECFWVLHLNNRLRIIGKELLAMGTVNAAITQSREVLKKLLSISRRNKMGATVYKVKYKGLYYVTEKEWDIIEKYLYSDEHGMFYLNKEKLEKAILEAKKAKEKLPEKLIKKLQKEIEEDEYGEVIFVVRS